MISWLLQVFLHAMTIMTLGKMPQHCLHVSPQKANFTRAKRPSVSSRLLTKALRRCSVIQQMPVLVSRSCEFTFANQQPVMASQSHSRPDVRHSVGGERACATFCHLFKLDQTSNSNQVSWESNSRRLGLMSIL